MDKTLPTEAEIQELRDLAAKVLRLNKVVWFMRGLAVSLM